jgi:enoyl-CoA hydratase
MLPQEEWDGSREEAFMSTDKSYQYLTSEKLGDYGLLLSINKEKKLNALDIELLEELLDFLNNFDSSKYRALVLTGAGEKAFIAGADIVEMSTMTSKEAVTFSKLGQDVTLKLETLGIPTIAAVNGHCLGGGFEMALACDYIYATENARFALPEVGLGLIPGFGGTQRLHKLVGRNKARQMIYTGSALKAQQAHELHVALGVFENKANMLEACLKDIQKIAANAPLAIKSAKEAINSGNHCSVPEGLNIEASTFSELFNLKDTKEGMQAFIEKRKAEFRGN